MAINNSTIIAKENIPQQFFQFDGELTPEIGEQTDGQDSSTNSSIVFVAALPGVLNHLHFSHDTNAQGVSGQAATLEFVKLSAAQTADAYVASPSTTTGTYLTVTTAGVRTTLDIETGAAATRTVDLSGLTLAQRTFAVGDRIVAITRQLRITGGAAASGSDPDSGFENAVAFGIFRGPSIY